MTDGNPLKTWTRGFVFQLLVWPTAPERLLTQGHLLYHLALFTCVYLSYLILSVALHDMDRIVHSPLICVQMRSFVAACALIYM